MIFVLLRRNERINMNKMAETDNRLSGFD